MCKDSKILKEDIEQLLQQIISKRSGKDFSGPRLRDEKLLGPKVGMPARSYFMFILISDNRWE